MNNAMCCLVFGKCFANSHTTFGQPLIYNDTMQQHSTGLTQHLIGVSMAAGYA